MLRVAFGFLLLGRAVPIVPVMPAPPPPAPVNPVTHDIPAAARTLLTGCWTTAYERWIIRASGASGAHTLEVVRTPDDADFAGYTARAKIPQPLMFDPTVGNYAFAAAGRIHGLLILFEIKRDTLAASVFTSHDGHSYAWTGNNMTLVPCAAK
jgi:hypothetical protein